jgi:hypothetical protein
MILELLATLVLGAVALGLLLGPLVGGERALPPRLPPEDEPPPPEETPRGRALLALRELDFDRATGKVAEGDYAALRERYLARAIAVLKADDRSDPAEALISRPSAAIGRGNGGAGPNCPRCGPRPEPDARFCSSCGAPASRGAATGSTGEPREHR